MSGFRKELLDKIVGINGHIFVAALDAPLTDYAQVAERVTKVAGVRRAVPLVEGQAFASSPYNGSGVLVRGVRAGGHPPDRGGRRQRPPGQPRRLRRGRRRDRAPPGRAPLAAGRRHHHAHQRRKAPRRRSAPRRGSKDTRSPRSSRSACPSSTRPSSSCRCRRRRPIFNREDDVKVIEVFLDDADRVDEARAGDRGGGRAADGPDRLAPAQPHLLRRPRGRAQRHVPHPHRRSCSSPRSTSSPG